MLIHGAAGGIGIAAIQVAKVFGAKVIATASTPEKRAVTGDHHIEWVSGKG